jgi:fatty-acyl-CoA synthase
MIDRLKKGMEAARALAKRGVLAAQAVRATGILGAVRPSAVARFVVGSIGLKRSPSLVLRFHACNTPDKLALVDGDARLSYRELEARVNRLAHGLKGLGVRPGARVALMMKNCHQYLEAQFALTRLGATAVQVGYRLKAGEVAYILQNSGSIAFLFQPEHAEVVREAAKEAGSPPAAALIEIGAPYEEMLRRGDPAAPPSVAGDEKGAVMVYTSGTTGRPKGAARGLDKTMHEAVTDFIRQVGIHHDDRHLVVCPLYHSAAPAFVALTYAVGGTVVLKDHFEPEAVLRTIEREQITSTFMVPTMLGRLVANADEVRRFDLSSVRWLMSGAAPLPTETARRVEEVFGPKLFNFYGATETGMVTLALPGEHTARPGTIGRALAGNEIRLLDEQGHDVPPGEVGELWARSSMLVAGYHGDPSATAKATRDGFFSVGDLGRVDADGYYYLADRKHDMVISGGVNIYPLEIEERIHAHPAVLECAIIGVPDTEWGESLRAFVVRRPNAELSAADVQQWCKDTLANYKCPKTVEFVDALPRTPTGKVLKRELRGR